jgi:hypothetical protein
VSPRPARPKRPKRPADDGANADTAALGTSAYAQSVYAEPTFGEPAAVPAYAEQNAWTPTHARDTFEPVETAEAQTRPAQQPFWALTPEERDVVDDRGVPIFRVGPTAWALVLEDRGEVFVVRHEDGRVGYLHDVSDVTRG